MKQGKTLAVQASSCATDRSSVFVILLFWKKKVVAMCNKACKSVGYLDVLRCLILGIDYCRT